MDKITIPIYEYPYRQGVKYFVLGDFKNNDEYYTAICTINSDSTQSSLRRTGLHYIVVHSIAKIVDKIPIQEALLKTRMALLQMELIKSLAPSSITHSKIRDLTLSTCKDAMDNMKEQLGFAYKRIRCAKII